MSNSNASEDRVRDEAYRLWEAAGRPHGRDAEFWHQACAVAGREPPTPAKVAAPAPKQRKKAAEPAAAEPPRRRPRKAAAQPNTPSA